jgi:hypothetical protein
MNDTIGTSSLKALFKFPFQGSNWKNSFIIGTALTFANFVLPIVPVLFVSGYTLRVMRQAIEGQEPTLPAWDDWGKLVTDGLRMALVSLVYLLPAGLVFIGGWGLYMITSFAMPLLLSDGGSGQGSSAFGLAMLAMFGSFAIMMISMFLGSLLLVLGAIPLPVATSHFVAQDKVGAAFHVREWWPILRANKLGYFVSWVVVMGLFAILYYAVSLAYTTVILCFVIPLLMAPIGFYLSLIGAALFGQTYRESTILLEAQTAGISTSNRMMPAEG